MPLRNDLQKVLIIGSGPIQIGQGAEFDYSGTQACLALKEDGIEVVLVNNNPATMMTDEMIANRVYMEPPTVQVVEKIIAKERPDGIIGTLGGQTGLNLTMELAEKGILAAYDVEVLGTPLHAIKQGEDRQLFRQLMLDIGEPIPESAIVTTVEEAMRFASTTCYPVIVRPAYTLGGEGGGVAYSDQELQEIARRGLQLSPVNQILVEKSMLGWKEIEYEVMRDRNGTTIIVCNMENVDPVGIHTGDSIVVAPSQTLTGEQYKLLRNASIKTIQALGIVGGCNIQFGLDPYSDTYNVIEVNPRVSRSSALASKATGYPIARMATKCAIGYHLDEIPNPITEKTYAAFEPALDYVVVKMPRFPFDKFPEGDRHLGTQMKATGEVMAIDRSFEGALNKAIRSLETNQYSITSNRYQALSEEDLVHCIQHPTDERLFLVGEALERGYSVEQMHEITNVDHWFLTKIAAIVHLERLFRQQTELSKSLLTQAKRYNVSEAFIAHCYGIELKDMRAICYANDLRIAYKQVDTCAGEFAAVTPYYYSTWNGYDEVEGSIGKKVLVIGSGPIRIGQGVEFDYCSVHATLALKQAGYTAIVMNNNPETVSTDYTVADRLYFEPLALEDVLAVIDKEQIKHVLIQFGGQTAINLANGLKQHGVNLLGTTLEGIEAVENRDSFFHLLKRLHIPFIHGETAKNAQQILRAAKKIQFPVIVRPSNVIGGQSMFIFHSEAELMAHAQSWQASYTQMWPLIMDEYKAGKECEVDAICDGENVLIPGIMEHMERAGVHSGDSIAIYPAVTLSQQQQTTIVDYTKQIAQAIGAKGLINIQFVIEGHTVYVLEVNPRSSRTVPMMSKVTKVPIMELAVNAQLGVSLTDSAYGIDLMPEVPFYSVKAPTFSGNKLPLVDHALGPEMKSTGEGLGVGTSVSEAMQKALYQLSLIPNSPIFCSISNDHKQASLSVIKQLHQIGIQFYATPNTAAFLQNHGIEAKVVPKHIAKIENMMKENLFQAVWCTPSQGRKKERFGFQLRALATKYRVTTFTHPDTLAYLSYVLEQQDLTVSTVSELHASIPTIS